MYRKLMNLAIWTGVILHLLFETTADYSWQQCLDAHNALRADHENTAPLKYSKELEQGAQTYADKLAGTTRGVVKPTRSLPKRRAIPDPTIPFNHKEMWDGEILYPDSDRYLNRYRRSNPIGESIHKFCCYSHPFCPPEFFYELSFPPSAKGVIRNFYSEINNYDFNSGGKKTARKEIRHFTNIVWGRTTEIGCAQSKMSSEKCIYTVVRYHTQGSIGTEDGFKENVQPMKKVSGQKSDSGKSYLVVFLVLLLVIFLLGGAGIFIFIKRDQFKQKYLVWKIKQDARKAEASLRGDEYYDSERRGSFVGKSTIFKPSAKKKERLSIEVIANDPPMPAVRVPFKPREATIIRREIVVMPGAFMNGKPISTSPTDKTAPPRPKSPPASGWPKPVSQQAKPVSQQAKPVSQQAKPVSQQAKPAITHNQKVPKIDIDYINIDRAKPDYINMDRAKPSKDASVIMNRQHLPSPRAEHPGADRPSSVGSFATGEQPKPKAVPRNKNPHFRTFPLPDKDGGDSVQNGDCQGESKVEQKRAAFEPKCQQDKKIIPPVKRPGLNFQRPHSHVPPQSLPKINNENERSSLFLTSDNSSNTGHEKVKKPLVPPGLKKPPGTEAKKPVISTGNKPKSEIKKPILNKTENVKKPVVPTVREKQKQILPPGNEKVKKPLLPPGKIEKKSPLPPVKPRKSDEDSEQTMTVSERRRLLEQQQGQR